MCQGLHVAVCRVVLWMLVLQLFAARSIMPRSIPSQGDTSTARPHDLRALFVSLKQCIAGSQSEGVAVCAAVELALCFVGCAP